jgi:hypothetical protein
MNPTHDPLPDGDRGGETYDPARDRDRLGRQARDVWDAMVGGQTHTLRSLEAVTGHPQASISARLRDFRKPEFGCHTVERLRRGDGGTYFYMLRPNRERQS